MGETLTTILVFSILIFFLLKIARKGEGFLPRDVEVDQSLLNGLLNKNVIAEQDVELIKKRRMPSNGNFGLYITALTKKNALIRAGSTETDATQTAVDYVKQGSIPAEDFSLFYDDRPLQEKSHKKEQTSGRTSLDLQINPTTGMPMATSITDVTGATKGGTPTSAIYKKNDY